MSQVYTLGPDGRAQPHLYAAVICVAKKQLYPAVKEIRKVGLPRLGSHALVAHMSAGWWGAARQTSGCTQDVCRAHCSSV